jgi:GNAT superfamily N-acetyltransferase
MAFMIGSMADEPAAGEIVVIRSPSTDEEWRQADALLCELKEWDGRQSRALGFDPDEVMKTFYPENVKEARYDSCPPAGLLLLAIHAGQPAGLAAYRQLTSNACELYDVYVRPASRGRGIGSGLLRTLMSHAKSAGYRTMCLETAIFMREAHSLYRALNFKAREPYRTIPAKFGPSMMWMEYSLAD